MTPLVTLFLRIASLAALLGTAHGEEAAALPRPEVIKMVNMMAEVDYGYIQDTGKWKEQLATRPDIKPDLFEMLRIALEVRKDFESVGRALAVFQLRKDLSGEELAKIIQPIIDYRNLKELTSLQRAYVYSGIQVLKYYPSSPHEDLVIAYLSSPEYTLKEAAARTAAEIGTERSLAPLRKLATDLKGTRGDQDRVYQEAMAAIAAIEKREAAPEKDPDQAK